MSSRPDSSEAAQPALGVEPLDARAQAADRQPGPLGHVGDRGGPEGGQVATGEVPDARRLIPEPLAEPSPGRDQRRPPPEGPRHVRRHVDQGCVAADPPPDEITRIARRPGGVVAQLDVLPRHVGEGEDGRREALGLRSRRVGRCGTRTLPTHAAEHREDGRQVAKVIRPGDGVDGHPHQRGLDDVAAPERGVQRAGVEGTQARPQRDVRRRGLLRLERAERLDRRRRWEARGLRSIWRASVARFRRSRVSTG